MNYLWYIHLKTRLVEKYRLLKFPALITVLGNTLNLAKVGRTGKHDILELILLNIQSSFFKFNIKFKLIAYNCYPLLTYYVKKFCRRQHQMVFGCFICLDVKENCLFSNLLNVFKSHQNPILSLNNISKTFLAEGTLFKRFLNLIIPKYDRTL